MTARHPAPEQGRHGGEALRLARALGVDPSELLDVSSNANCLAEPLTAELVARTPYDFARYPDDECAALRAAVAEHEGVSPSMVLPGNGSSECISLAFQAIRPRTAVLCTPLFSEYKRSCRAHGVQWREHRLDPAAGFAPTPGDVAALAEAECDLLVVCSPNNPTGACFQALAALLERARCKWVLLDATYREFLHSTPAYRAHAWDALQAACGDTRLLVLSSFTKFFYCTGVRLGYALGEADAVEALARFQPPWSVTDFAQRLGVAMLERLEEYRAATRPLPALRAELAEALRAAPAVVEVLPASANFLLLRLRPGLGAAEARAQLLARRIIPRDCSNIPGLAPEPDGGGWLRVQVRGQADNDRLARAVHGLG